jgi:1-phosphatidylinositol phosphodiesterase
MAANWTVPAALSVGDAAVKTVYSPAILGFDGKLYVLWNDAGTNDLVYSISQNDPASESDATTFWTRRTWTEKKTAAQEKPTGSPALQALDGTIHVVFPDKNKNLVHYQYIDEPTDQYWGRRAGLVAQTNESPALAVYGGFLYCVYKDAVSNRLSMVYWGPNMGWSLPHDVQGVPTTRGQIALFELNGKLQLLVSSTGPDGAQKPEIKGFIHNPGAAWTAVPEQILAGGITSSFGVSATCFNSNAYMAYSTEDYVSTKHFAQMWQKYEKQSAKTSKTPAITILDNVVICIWPNQTGDLQYMTRKAWALPGLDNWMSAINEQISISELTIPGTHDSAARTDFPFAETHSKSISDQLAQGIRYLDIRGSYFSHALPFVYKSVFTGQDPTEVCAFHNFVPIFTTVQRQGKTVQVPLTISAIFEELYKFLGNKTHANESIIVQIKQDAGSNDAVSAAKFAADIQRLISTKGKSKFWRTDASVPRLSQLRGKIQLVRRFPLPAGTDSYGIDVFGPDWRNSDVSTIPAAGPPRVQIQDVWSFTAGEISAAIPEKWGAVKRHLEAAVADQDKSVLYLNFCSANGPPTVTPREFARGGWQFEPMPYGVETFEIEGINKRLDTYFNDVVVAPGRYGVILLDYPEDPEELIVGLVKSNANKFNKV